MGEVFAGRYELVDLLGEGGMGSVWRAWDHRAGCYVAAKVLRQSDAASLLRFVREQTFRIAHPHVVAPRGWAGEDDRVLFTMDLVRGGSLATLLGDYGPLPAQWVAVLIDQVLAGLSAVHAAGLVHRDIKPGNVLLEPTGHGQPMAKLTDFGVAVAMAEPRLTRTSQLVGTPGYLAPEVVRGADPEPRHDLYAVGVLAAELLSGSRPDPLSDTGWSSPGGAAAPLWSYARRLAARAPGERPDSCEQARTELAELGVLPAQGALPDDEGADIEVLDVVGPLPPGWTADGPDRPRPSERGVAVLANDRAGGPVAEPVGHRAAEPVGHRAAEAVGHRAGGRAGDGAGRQLPPPRTPAARRRRRALAVVSGVLIVAGLGLGAWVLTNGSLWSGTTPSPDRTTSPQPGVGTACDFTEAGQRATTPEGVLVCRRQTDGSYTWQQ